MVEGKECVWRKGRLVEGREGCGRKVIFDMRVVGSEGGGMRKNEGREECIVKKANILL